MSLIYTILIFILTISIIVTFHEFGHYIAARICGVKVLEFSIGFGRRLIGKKIGKDKTDYKICVLPLGGYVKMLDEREGKVKDFEKNRSFNNQTLLKRSIIVFSGPLFNFILAIFFYFLIFLSGYSGFKPSVGSLINNSVAENIGVIEGDIISSVNSKNVMTWSDAILQTIKNASEKKNIDLEVIRNNEVIKLKEIDYKKINFDSKNIFEDIGILNFASKSVTVGYVEKNSAAYFSGLLVGDKILTVDKIKVKNWNEIVNFIKKNPGVKLNLYILRNNYNKTISVTPDKVMNNSLEIGRLGISPFINDVEIANNKVNVKYGIFESFKLSTYKTYDFTLLTFNFIFRLIKGDVSSNSISGPVGIAGYASESFSSGYTNFLGLLAMLSISIGILNLLPIPMLDGGHLMYYLVEFVTRRPIPDKVQLIFQQVGMVFLILLSIFALYNDLLRIM
tara:strand:- start:460 stop:1809 length:1350 start_codon:yes stop_codon:yes gene_type:complete